MNKSNAKQLGKGACVGVMAIAAGIDPLSITWWFFVVASGVLLALIRSEH